MKTVVLESPEKEKKYWNPDKKSFGTVDAEHPYGWECTEEDLKAAKEVAKSKGLAGVVGLTEVLK